MLLGTYAQVPLRVEAVGRGGPDDTIFVERKMLAAVVTCVAFYIVHSLMPLSVQYSYTHLAVRLLWTVHGGADVQRAALFISRESCVIVDCCRVKRQGRGPRTSSPPAPLSRARTVSSLSAVAKVPLPRCTIYRPSEVGGPWSQETLYLDSSVFQKTSAPQRHGTQRSTYNFI